MMPMAYLTEKLIAMSYDNWGLRHCTLIDSLMFLFLWTNYE